MSAGTTAGEMDIYIYIYIYERERERESESESERERERVHKISLKSEHFLYKHSDSRHSAELHNQRNTETSGVNAALCSSCVLLHHASFHT